MIHLEIVRCYILDALSSAPYRRWKNSSGAKPPPPSSLPYINTDATFAGYKKKEAEDNSRAVSQQPGSTASMLSASLTYLCKLSPGSSVCSFAGRARKIANLYGSGRSVSRGVQNPGVPWGSKSSCTCWGSKSRNYPEIASKMPKRQL